MQRCPCKKNKKNPGVRARSRGKKKKVEKQILKRLRKSEYGREKELEDGSSERLSLLRPTEINGGTGVRRSLYIDLGHRQNTEQCPYFVWVGIERKRPESEEGGMDPFAKAIRIGLGRTGIKRGASLGDGKWMPEMGRK